MNFFYFAISIVSITCPLILLYYAFSGQYPIEDEGEAKRKGIFAGIGIIALPICIVIFLILFILGVLL